MYKDYASFLAERFDRKIQKLAVNAGFSCPNRDGTIGRGGCIYCTNVAFNPSYCDATLTVAQQLERGKAFYAHKYPDMDYLAYFQAYSNTHAPVERLRTLYDEALSVDGVVGLVIATRPDCLGDDVLDLLEEFSKQTTLIVELGVETIHDVTLEAVNRCHKWTTAHDSIVKLDARGITVGVHLILGLPGETVEMMVQSVQEIVTLPVKLIKFHQMQVLKGTKLAQQWERGEVQLKQWNVEQYASLCARLLRLVPRHIAVERFVSQSPPSMLVSPRWNLKTGEFAALLNKKLLEQ